MKFSIWNAESAKKAIEKRFQNSSKDRSYYESMWKHNERTLYSTSSTRNTLLQGNRSLDFSLSEALSNIDQSNADINVSYVMKNLRYIHAQMSSNPPVVAMRPTTSDQDDHRKADAADRLVRWALREYKLQEKQDQCNLHTLLYGTGFMKTVWDSTKGAILDVDQESGEMKLEGDIDISIPFIWNIFLDPDAKAWDEVKWVIERIYIDYEEACVRWPDKIEILQESRVEDTVATTKGYQSDLRDYRYNSVELYEYWEKGLPSNGYLGRYCIVNKTFDVVEDPRPSPFRFKKAGAVNNIEASDLPDEVKEAKIKKLPEQADLPYHILTEIDVPNVVWGKSSVEYASTLQESLNRLDSARLDNIQAHGVARMIVQKGAGINEDAISNTPWDVIEVDSNQPPYFMQSPTLMPEMSSERNNYIQGIGDVMGTNESMFGQQSREQSGASMQYATNQGNMVRRRLFNKYTMCVESLYRGILNLIRKHWSITRTISVIGKEKALEAADIKGADIDGGYDVMGEYGTTLSLDPITRREEILTLQPLFKEAGVPTRTIMRMLKLNEIEGIFDDLDLAENRQKEIFDEMSATGMYLAPEEQMDHENMIAWAMHYFMTQEFSALPADVKALLKQHNKERAQLAATEKGAGGAAATPEAINQQAGTSPGPMPGGGDAVPTGPLPPPAAGPAPAGGSPATAAPPGAPVQ